MQIVAFFHIENSVLSSLLMEVPPSSVNMERLKDRNVELGAIVNIYVKK